MAGRGRGRGRGRNPRGRGGRHGRHPFNAAHPAPVEDPEEAALAEAIRLSLAEAEHDPAEEDLRKAIQDSLRTAGLDPNPVDPHPDRSAIDGEPDRQMDDEPSSSSNFVSSGRSTRSTRYRKARKAPSLPPSPEGSNSAPEIDLSDEDEEEEMEGPSSTQTLESRSRLDIQIVTAAQGVRGKNPVFGRVETFIRNAFDQAELPTPTMKKMEILMSNASIEHDFQAFQQNLKPSESVPVLLFHAAQQANLGSEFVLKHNLSGAHSTGQKPYGPGLYFTALPSIQEVSEFSVLVCQVLKGSEFMDDTNAPIPDGYHSKSVNIGGSLSDEKCKMPPIGSKMIHVIPYSRQISPLAIVHCSL